ncbi:MAG TPA: 1-acyl-sn-glycerol-3-phosphate acyltransferase [Myxococcota bacterium]|nr:1-acyl-sn-glycerol-3-phosphate acyltransferase [Myxococcota bacterium]
MSERDGEELLEVGEAKVGFRGGLLPYVPIELYRSAMLRVWGVCYYLFGFAYFFRKLRLTQPSGERVRQALGRGPVVYVLHTRSIVDYLALNEVLRRRRLPLADYGTGISMTAFMPLVDAIPMLWHKVVWFAKNGRLPNPVDVGWLSRAVARGSNAAVFLKPDQKWRDFFTPPSWPDPVPALLQAQEHSERPVQLLPVVVIWQREPERARRQTMRWLLGTEESQGSFAKLLGVALGHRRAVVQVGEAVDVAEYRERFADEEGPSLAKRLRLMLRRYLFREQQVVRGPALKSPAWTRRLVLNSNRVGSLVDAEAEATRRPVASIQREVLKTYDKMAARFSFGAIRPAEVITSFLWNSIFRGIDVRLEDVEKIRQAARSGVAVLVPSHRSHLDYVLLSSVLNEHDVVIPHIIAGDNLSFFPLGFFFRRLGAIFIKRSFKGERIFPTLFSAYLTHLFREGYTVEFFIEGGRSRTGKCLPPKLGILGHTVDAGVEARLGRTLGEVSYLPISITYEQVAEEGPYARELAGESKRPEDLGALVRAARVVLKQYGRVYVRVGEPVKLAEALADCDWSSMDRAEKREVLSGLGETIIHQIDRQTVVLPTALVALALLAQSRPGVPGQVLQARVERFRTLLVEAGAEMSRSLEDPDWAREIAMKRFCDAKMVEELTGADDVVFRPVADQRVTLEYYKNGVLHFLLPASMMCSEIRARGNDRFRPSELQDALRFQLFLLRYEFFLDPEHAEEDLIDLALRQLVAVGAAQELEDGQWEVVERARVSELAELTLNFLESYYLVLRALPQLKHRDLARNELAREVQKIGRQFLAVQDIRRPEATSLVNLENALKAFAEDGVYTLKADGGFVTNPDAGRHYVEKLRRLMRLEGPTDETRLHS